MAKIPPPASCPKCGLMSREYDEHGYNTNSLRDIIRQFWVEHTDQACELAARV